MGQPPFQLSPLQLESYYIKECSFAIKDNFVDRQQDFTPVDMPRLIANVTQTPADQDPRHWRIELFVQSHDDASTEFPYSVEIVLVGFFKVHESYPDERVKALARINGPSLLYSAARETLLTVTSRTGYPALILPTLVFIPPTSKVPIVTKKVSAGKVLSKKRKTKALTTKSRKKAD